MKSLASIFPSASQSFFLIASHPAFSLAMMSASDGAAVDFISPLLFAFDMVSLFPGGCVAHAPTATRKHTSARIFFITTPLVGNLVKSVAASITKPCSASRILHLLIQVSAKNLLINALSLWKRVWGEGVAE